MANKSNWKGTESKAAALFPGGRRRQRVGFFGRAYYTVADDVVWGPEKTVREKGKPTRIVKQPLQGQDEKFPPVYVDAKKKTNSYVHKEFSEIKEKYVGSSDARLVVVRQRLNSRLVMVTLEGEFFAELLRAWCEKHGIEVEDGQGD